MQTTTASSSRRTTTSNRMKNRSGRPEVLAPAGDFTCLQAAIDAGADAVYFGLGTFNMRARSGVNFTESDLPEVSSRCRAAGVCAYLALNAIMFEGEIAEIDRTIMAAKPFVDAFIVSDWGVIALCRKHGAPFHVSTRWPSRSLPRRVRRVWSWRVNARLRRSRISSRKVRSRSSASFTARSAWRSPDAAS